MGFPLASRAVFSFADGNFHSLTGTASWVFEQVLDLESLRAELLGRCHHFRALLVLLTDQSLFQIEESRELYRVT